MNEGRISTTTLGKQNVFLANRVEQGFAELKELLRGFDARVRYVENQEASCKPLLENQIVALYKKIDDQDVDIRVLNQAVLEMKLAVVELKRTQTILSWLGGILGSTLLVWIVTQILGIAH